MRDYEPPVVEEGTMDIDARITSLPVLAPGVRGYAIQQRDRIFIPVIVAEEPGSGAVGKFLDSLSPRCVVPNVVSFKLTGMLARRGWTLETVRDELFNEDVEIWVAPAA